MLKKSPIILISLAVLLAPSAALALAMPQNSTDLVNLAGLNAQSYAAMDVKTGQLLIAKNADLPWPPASLTKLVTVLVVLDSKVKLGKTVAITAADQATGACKSGGSCIKAKAGVKFTVNGLLHAALMPSANNAASALARSTGLTTAQFVQKMNQKAVSLGAVQTLFYEPTGMDPANRTTAGDFTKIVAAAFANPNLRAIAGLSRYTLYSTNFSRYTQTIKNTDKLLGDAEVQILGAKTGYLDEARYNFASLLKYRDGQQLAVVVLGEDHLYSAFAETKQIANLAKQAQDLAAQNAAGAVLGANTFQTTKP